MKLNTHIYFKGQKISRIELPLTEYFDLPGRKVLASGEESSEIRHNVRSLESILKVHPVSGEMECIRYQHYDRAPIRTIHPDQINQYYTALAKLSQRIEVSQ